MIYCWNYKGFVMSGNYYYDKIEYKDGIVYACLGESDKPITREYFKSRSGISHEMTIDRIVKNTNFKFKS